MANRIRIPDPLREFTDNNEFVEVNAPDIGTAITNLLSRFPDIREHLVDDTGDLRRFVCVYVNKEDIRFLQNQQTPLKDGDEILIVPGLIHQSSAVAAIAVADSLSISRGSNLN